MLLIGRKNQVVILRISDILTSSLHDNEIPLVLVNDIFHGESSLKVNLKECTELYFRPITTEISPVFILYAVDHMVIFWETELNMFMVSFWLLIPFLRSNSSQTVSYRQQFPCRFGSTWRRMKFVETWKEFSFRKTTI